MSAASVTAAASIHTSEYRLTSAIETLPGGCGRASMACAAAAVPNTMRTAALAASEATRGWSWGA
ncbi:MAG: hypothetical protein U0326_26700 [Polyangiales bacterium]